MTKRERIKKTNNGLQNTAQKTNDWATRTPQKTGDELEGSGFWIQQAFIYINEHMKPAYASFSKQWESI